MSKPPKPTYTDLPLEVREQILVYCTPATLASLCSAGKSVAPEAERMLYSAVSLHDTRGIQMHQCLETLEVPRKACLVRTFVVTFARGVSPDIPLGRLGSYVERVADALSKMKHLKVLSFWLADDTETRALDWVIQGQFFNLQRIYVSSLKNLPRLMHYQPQLEVIGLWSQEYMVIDQYATEDLRPSLARHRLSGLRRQPGSDEPLTQESKPRPIIFGISRPYSGSVSQTERALTIFDYPLGKKESKGGWSDNPDFLEIPAQNYETFKIIQDDLQIKLATDKPDNMWTNLLRLVLPDLSAPSLEWARKAAERILKSYSRRHHAFVHFSIIQPPLPSEFSLDPSACERFKLLITTLFDHKIDDIGFFDFNDGSRRKYLPDEVRVEAMARRVYTLIDEAIGSKLPKGRTLGFEFHLFHCEGFALPRDREYLGL
ncbi:hypothetical protein NMY22_g19562 [Coprinellus aureogranulatus]|nr:hypothetical protein NMY22_g19562 [Coprinellus aureogranulatus]